MPPRTTVANNPRARSPAGAALVLRSGSAESATGQSSAPAGPDSYWETKLDITPRTRDRTQWNRDWEKRTKSLKAQKVFDWVGRLLQDRTSMSRASLQQLKDEVMREQQRAERNIRMLFGLGTIRGTWLLLPESERRRHVDAGLEGACTKSSLHQDGRALCPDITAKAMLKSGGQAFLDYLTRFLELKETVDSTQPFVFPCPWWDSAADARPKPLSARDNLILGIGTFHRTFFICMYLDRAMLSTLCDMNRHIHLGLGHICFARHGRREQRDEPDLGAGAEGQDDGITHGACDEARRDRTRCEVRELQERARR